MKLGTLGMTVVTGVVMITCLNTPAEAKRRTFTFESDTTMSVAGDAWIEVDNTVGDITLIPGKPSQITIHRLARIAAADSSQAEDFLEDIDVRYRASDNGVRIKATIHDNRRSFSFFDGLFSGTGSRRSHIDFEIEVPENCDVSILTTSGDIDLAGLTGDIDIEATSGDMIIDDIRGHLDIRATSGDIRIARVDADASIEVSSGDITAKRIKGDLNIIASSGDITIRELTGHVISKTSSGDQELIGITGSVRARATSGNIECSVENGDIDIEASSGDARIDTRLPTDGRCMIATSSGDVTLSLAENPGAVIEIETRSGDTDDDLGVDWRRESRRRRLGTFGAGAAEVQISTGSGDIRLRGTP